jgi:tetratricopeptide (TPR) repeat protein/2-polyprenyl-3-methyl-5-hydroxy-6-metoxy-1,4-benzoquinol methylase
MGERKRRLAAGGTSQSHFDRDSIAAAFRALETGDRAGAERAFERLVAMDVDHPPALHAAGVIALQLGRAASAEALLVKAIALEPRDPAARCHLAIAYRRVGKPDLAIAELEKALELDPRLVEAHSNLGNLLLERGDGEAAMRSFERALVARRDYPEALNGLGDAQLMSGKYESACANLERAVALDPGFHEGWYNLSRARTQWAFAATSGGAAPSPVTAHAERGLESIVAALELNADSAAYWIQFETCVKNFDFHHPLDPRLHALLLRALDHPAVDPAGLARPVVSLVLTHPQARAIESVLSSGGAIDDPRWPKLAYSVSIVLGEALTQRLLESIVVPSALLQRLCAAARRGLLDEWPGVEATLPLECIAAIAQQAFNTEYVNDETAAEGAAVAQLGGSIADARAEGRAVPLHWYALYGCYRPLHSLDASEGIAADLRSTALRALVTRQIDEPLEERRLRSEIPQLTEASNDVSAQVQEQYEANPYPRWVHVRRDAAQPTVAAFIRRLFPGADLKELDSSPARILIAGCGTGRHPLSTAFRFPDARIVALDLSRSSLAYALRKTHEQGIGTIQYAQADILGLASFADRFNVIECTGVLHHLPDPVAGWRILEALLVPGGLMRIGLYSDIARRHVVRAREVVAAHRFTPTHAGIREFRRFVFAHDADPLLARLARGEDFYSTSGLRDLVFNVQEHRFTLPQIAAILSELRLTFLGFEFGDSGTAPAYRARFPADRTLDSLDNWHAFEASRPDTFAQMYQFWVLKPRRSA